jgi:hypothetical protein
MKQIIIEITDTGDISIETRGFVGKSCITESKFIKDLLGQEVSSQLTPAYYQNDQKQTVKKHLPLCG